jgi:L-iditol 2-dehydrogenase
MKTEMTIFQLSEPGKIEKKTIAVPRPKSGEVLIKVERCGICGSDLTIFNGRHPYAISPLIMGHEFAGIVEEVGGNVESRQKGDRVTVIPHLTCGECGPCRERKYNFCEQLRCMGAEAHGAHCEYIVVPFDMAVQIPSSMSLEQGALIEPACVAYHAAKRGSIGKDDSVLVLGAGPIGNFVMQSAKALGAKNVYIADLMQNRLDLARECGASGTINLSDRSLKEMMFDVLGGSDSVDVFFDCVGGKGEVLNEILSVAKRGSRIVVAGVLQTGTDVPLLPDFVQHELMLSGTTMYVPGDYSDMIRLMEKGKIITDSIVNHRIGFESIPDFFPVLNEDREKYYKVMIEYA